MTLTQLKHHILLWDGFGGEVLAIALRPKGLADLSEAVGQYPPFVLQVYGRDIWVVPGYYDAVLVRPRCARMPVKGDRQPAFDRERWYQLDSPYYPHRVTVGELSKGA